MIASVIAPQVETVTASGGANWLGICSRSRVMIKLEMETKKQTAEEAYRLLLSLPFH